MSENSATLFFQEVRLCFLKGLSPLFEFWVWLLFLQPDGRKKKYQAHTVRCKRKGECIALFGKCTERVLMVLFCSLRMTGALSSACFFFFILFLNTVNLLPIRDVSSHPLPVLSWGSFADVRWEEVVEINRPEGSFLMFLKLELHWQLFCAQQARSKNIRKYSTTSATLFTVLSCMNLILDSINVGKFCLQILKTQLLQKSGVNVNFLNAFDKSNQTHGCPEKSNALQHKKTPANRKTIQKAHKTQQKLNKMQWK